MTSIEVLVARLENSVEGREELLAKLQEKADKIGVSLSFGDAFATDECQTGYDIFSGGPAYFDGRQWDSITPQVYLDALREHLIERLQNSEQAEADLRNLILRFTTKKVGHRALKDAIA